MSVNGRMGTVLVVFLLITSVGTIGAVEEMPLEDAFDGITPTEEADEVYITEAGEAVLVYHHSSDRSSHEGEFGVEPGSIYAQYEGDLEERPAVIGDATTRLDGQSLSSSGDLLVTETDRIVDLEAAVDVHRTGQDSSSSVDVYATVTDLETGYEAVHSDGELEVGPETLVASGTTRTVANDSAVPVRTDDLEATVTETEAGYGLEVRERRPVEDWERDRWDTREDAAETLENRYASIAITLGGTADGDLEEYRFDDDVVAYEYEVEFVGIEQRATEMAVTLGQQRSEIDLDETQTRAMADRLAQADLEELSFAVDRDGRQTDIEWRLEVRGYDELVLGTVEIADALEGIDDGVTDRFDEVSETFDARAAADLHQRAAWNVSVVDRDDVTTVDATWDTEAEGWADYVAELEERDLESLVPWTVATARVETTTEGIEVVYDYERAHDGAFEMDLDGPAGDVTDIVSPAPFDGALKTAELARVDVAIDEGSYELEAAAVDPGVLDTLSSSLGESVTEAHVETADGSSTAYVVLEEFVEEPTDEEIQDREQVGADTDVYGPGEWDREFPTLDHQRVESFLDTDLEEATGDDGERTVAVPVLVGGFLLIALGVLYAVRRGSLERADEG
ncbi:hypothetical protein ACYJ1Y_06070 [Natrialbaceae archaeon A-gly3]